MGSSLKRPLEAVVFVCGACVMVIELVGSRLMAPYLGTSLFVWTSLIGVILGCLSLGYWFGGLLADKKPEAKILSAILLLSGLSVAAIAVAGDVVLYWMQSTFTDIRVSAVLATLVLFGIPSVLLGTVSPFAIRLKLSRVENSGSTAGELYALSTLGSIAGTFLAGFVLLSFFGHREILFMISFTLLALVPVAAWAGKAQKVKWVLALLAVAGASLTQPFVQSVMGEGFTEIPTAYNRVWVYDAFLAGKPVRVLQLNDSSDSAIFLNDDRLALEYTQYFRLGGHFLPGVRKALMIGGGAYSYPKHFLKEFPDARMDVVEIDPKLTETAKKYFGLTDDLRMTIFHEDARTFLNKTQERYEIIFDDVFKSRSIPFQLATREAMQKASERLTDDGLMVINVISSIEGRDGRLLRAILATLDEFFPQIYVFSVGYPEDGQKLQNLVVVAFKTKQKRKMFSQDAEINHCLGRIWVKDIPRDVPVLTDSLAPVERYISGWVTYDPNNRNGILQKKIQSARYA